MRTADSPTYFLASILFKWSDKAATKMTGWELLLIARDPWWGAVTLTHLASRNNSSGASAATTLCRETVA